MRSRYKIAELESPHFITCTIVGWLPVFTRIKYLDNVLEEQIESILFGNNELKLTSEKHMESILFAKQIYFQG